MDSNASTDDVAFADAAIHNQNASHVTANVEQATMGASDAQAWEEEAAAAALPPPSVPPGPSPQRPPQQPAWRLGLPRWPRQGRGRPHSADAPRRASPPRTPRSSNLRGTHSRGEADQFQIDSASERADVEDIARVVNEHTEHTAGWLEQRDKEFYEQMR